MPSSCRIIPPLLEPMNLKDFDGLIALLDTAFPKTCRSCGYVYVSTEQFFSETRDMPGGRSSLKADYESEGQVLVEAFRNCRCGSTLMDEFACRRDTSAEGDRKRQVFDALLRLLQAEAGDPQTARRQILDLLREEACDLETLLQLIASQSGRR